VIDHVNAKMVAVEERINGKMLITYKGKSLRYKLISERPVKEQDKSYMSKAYNRSPIPLKDHPWRKFKIKRYSQSCTYSQKEKGLLLTKP